MLAVLSPSKTLDFDSVLPPHRTTRPRHLQEASMLVEVLRKKSRPQLRELMNLSENLADLNFRRYRDWDPGVTDDNARAALLAFTGDVYTGFDLSTYGADDFRFAQGHLRILSGLYGVLRPLDLMQPYRLEMGTALKTKRGRNLYEFWGDTLARDLRAALAKTENKVLVNLASNEYFSAVPGEVLGAEVITPHFREWKNGAYKFLSFYGKKARGLMADFLVRERIEEPEDLKGFSRAGYSFNRELSGETDWVFTRDEIPAA